MTLIGVAILGFGVELVYVSRIPESAPFAGMERGTMSYSVWFWFGKLELGLITPIPRKEL